MKKLTSFIVSALLLFASANARAFETRYADAVFGGQAGAMDAINGAILSDGDHCEVIDPVTLQKTIYVLDADSGAAQNPPYVVTPTANAGTKRWVLASLQVKGIKLQSGATIYDMSTDGTLAGDSDGAVPTEKAVNTKITTEIAAVNASIAGFTVSSDFQGFVHRANFSWLSTSSIRLGNGRYHHTGTTEQIVYWVGTIDKTFTGLSGTRWAYVIIDDSALSGEVITAAQIGYTYTEPTRSNLGHYVGDDRVICAVYLVNGEIQPFHHEGGRFFAYLNPITDVEANLSDSWAWFALTAPGFCRQAEIFWSTAHFQSYNGYFRYRPAGSTSTNGLEVGIGHLSYGAWQRGSLRVLMDSSQRIELRDNMDNPTMVCTLGYYFPGGM